MRRRIGARSRRVAETMTCFVIAEMANAHGGSPETAEAIVKAAAEAGADAVKFQVFAAAELAVPDFSHFGVYEKLQLSEEVWSSLITDARELGLQVYADVFGVESASLMDRLGVDGFMIHVADIMNTPLLRRVGRTGRPAILSVAGSTREEVTDAIIVLETAGAPSVLLMHGFQGYPTALSDSCLNRLRLLSSEFSRHVGFASHVDGASLEAGLLPVLAMGAGAEAVEVHLTLDRSKKGFDYYSSMEPAEFAEMVRVLRVMESALGSNSGAVPAKEVVYRSDHRKCLIVTRDIEPEDVIQEEDVAFRRINNPPSDPSPSLDRVLGRAANTLILKYSPITEEGLHPESELGR